MKRIDEAVLNDILEGRTALKKSKKKDLDDAVEDGEYDSNVPNSEELPDGPPQAGRTPSNKAVADMDAEDTLEAITMLSPKKAKEKEAANAARDKAERAIETGVKNARSAELRAKRDNK